MFYLSLCLTIVWFIVMFWLSHQNGEHTKETSLNLSKKLKSSFFLKLDIATLNNYLRKLAHIIVFTIFSILFAITLVTGKLSPYLFILVVFWAWGDEKSKVFIKGRHFSWFDVLLNLLGVMIGVLCFILLGIK